MSIEKFAELGNQMQPRERNWGANPKSPLKTGTSAVGCRFSFVRLCNRAQGTFIERDTCFRWRQFAGRTNEKTYTQTVFQSCDRLGNRWLTSIKVTCSGRERAGLHHSYKRLHCAQSTHSYSVLE